MAKKSKGPILTGLSKPIPKMPEGYYSGDKPNPNLRSFVEAHILECPYDSKTDAYDVRAFDRPLKTKKTTAIYNMHTYHQGKKPHDAIREYVQHYTQAGDLVLDPFCGSGSTALAALMEGRRAVAVDRSPAATYVTKNYCTLVDPNGLRAALESLRAAVYPEIKWLYETRCNRCDGEATTEHTVYSQVFQCPRCLEKVALFDCVEAEGTTKAGKPKKIRVCPCCYSKGIEEEISTRTEKFGAIPVKVRYRCLSGCDPKYDERSHRDANPKKRQYFERFDLGKLSEIERTAVPHWFPAHRMMNVADDTVPWGDKWRAGTSNFRTVAELFTKRNLWALASIMSGANKAVTEEYQDLMRFATTGIMMGLSWMNQYIPRGTFPFYLMRGTYYVPPIHCDESAWKHFANKVDRLAKGVETVLDQACSSDICVSCQSSTDLGQIPTDSVDYIFTDPPYGDNVQYGELNFVWEAWLDLDTRWHDDEIIVNNTRGKTRADWADMMRQAMAESFRVLKPGRWLSLCYHDTSEGTWHLVQDIMAEVGFVTDRGGDALYIDAGQKSYNQLMADKVTKRDLVINFRKPRPDEGMAAIVLTGDEDETTFLEKVRDVVRAFLQANPGSTKDRVFDEVVSRLVRRGRMEAFQFDRVLEELAEPVEGRVMENLFEAKRPDLLRTHVVNKWYLKDAVDQVDEAESRREDAAADRLEGFMREYLRTNPEKLGVHYSDLFEQVVMLSERPRRDMADWLWDYFIKTDEGTWRPPATEEEREEKRRQRATGAIRKIKSFAKALDRGDEIPKRLRPDSDRTLADWIRQARRAGLYQQGRSLFEKGGLNLSRLQEADENLAMDVNEDYRYCLKQLSDGKGI